MFFYITVDYDYWKDAYKSSWKKDANMELPTKRKILLKELSNLI